MSANQQAASGGMTRPLITLAQQLYLVNVARCPHRAADQITG
jgi:hypothetical protein